MLSPEYNVQLEKRNIKNMFNVQHWQIDDHKNIDDNLFNDIVNKIHEHGCNNLKDTKKILEFCGKDDELSMLIGIMRIKFTYVEAVRENIYNSKSGTDRKKVIEDLRNGKLEIPPEKQNQLYEIALKNYNGSPKSEVYKKSTINILTNVFHSEFMPIVR